MTKDNSGKRKINFLEFPVKNESDLVKTKSFYSAVFNWDYTDWGSDYSDTLDSGLATGLNADPEHKPKHPMAVIQVKKLEKYKELIISSGGIITKEIFSFPGGRRFHFVDPAGNELAVWSDK